MRLTPSRAAAFRGVPLRGEAGFAIADALIAVAVLAIGLVAIVNVLPYTARAQTEALTMTASNVLALSKIDEIRTMPFDQIEATSSGTFDALINPNPGDDNFTNLKTYRWRYTATEVIPGKLKRVDLAILRKVGGTEVADSYVFYVADEKDEE